MQKHTKEERERRSGPWMASNVNTMAIFDDLRDCVDPSWMERIVTGTSESCLLVLDTWSELLSFLPESLIANADVVLKFLSWRLLVRPTPVLIDRLFSFVNDFISLLIERRWAFCGAAR